MKSVHSTNLLNSFFESQPELDISYISKLSSASGIYQHASFNIPNYHHGYCLDDNSRALLLLVKAHEINVSFVDHPLLSTYLSFILYAQNQDGTFKNFMSFDLKFLESRGSDDSAGRALWAIGTLLGNLYFARYHDIAREIFNRSLDKLLDIRSARAAGYALLGVLSFIRANPEDAHAIEVARSLADFLAKEYQACHDDKWSWYEEIISYDNAILPLAMLQASSVLSDEKWEEIGLASFNFLDKVLFEKDQLSIIGNQGWYNKNGKINRSGQQPIEVPSIMLMYQQAYLVDKNTQHLQKMRMAFLWYLGENDKGLSLYNPLERSCYDGLEDFGVNKNQGAESNIAFWTSYILAKGIDPTMVSSRY